MNLDASLDLKAERAAAPRSLLHRALKQAGTMLLILVLAYGVFQFITHYVLQSVQIIGASMSPTLHDSGRYVLNRWIYHVREPQPTDIVVLRDPAEDCYAVKRIIAK